MIVKKGNLSLKEYQKRYQKEYRRKKLLRNKSKTIPIDIWQISEPQLKVLKLIEKTETHGRHVSGIHKRTREALLARSLIKENHKCKCKEYFVLTKKGSNLLKKIGK